MKALMALKDSRLMIILAVDPRILPDQLLLREIRKIIEQSKLFTALASKKLPLDSKEFQAEHPYLRYGYYLSRRFFELEAACWARKIDLKGIQPDFHVWAAHSKFFKNKEIAPQEILEHLGIVRDLIEADTIRFRYYNWRISKATALYIANRAIARKCQEISGISSVKEISSSGNPAPIAQKGTSLLTVHSALPADGATPVSI